MTETALVQSSNIQLDDATMLKLVAGGDTGQLTAAQKLAYYKARCEAAGLDPRTHPFEFTKLSGKEVLYAKKAASDALASKHGIVCHIQGKETVEGVHVVTVRATARDGRETDDIGAVNIASKKGDDLANALMKTVTKAKRRAILSLCGLGMLDEIELETVPSAVRSADNGNGNGAKKAEQIPDAAEKLFNEIKEGLKKGFSSPDGKLHWKQVNRDRINALPPAYRQAIVAAFEAAPVNP